MVTIERRVGGFLRYRKVWFATPEAGRDICQSLGPKDVVRFFGAATDFGALPRLVKHRQLRTAWIDLSPGPEQILNGMKRKSCRYEIGRAEKMLDRVEIQVSTPKAQRDFLALYNDFATARHLPRFPAPWLVEYSTRGEPLVLYLNGEPLCCHFMLCDPDAGIVRLLHSGSRRLESPEYSAACGPLNRYLHWHAIQRYHAQGYKTFDFGGIRNSEEPISRFKLSFGAAIVTEHYYLFSGTRWVARLGNLVYERVLRRSIPVEKKALGNSAE